MKRTLEKIVDYAIKITEPEEIILFGSTANGTANVFSDVDLLIISDNPLIKKDAVVRIRNFSESYCLKADVLIYTKAELKTELNTPFSFVSAIVKTGKIIYKK